MKHSELKSRFNQHGFSLVELGVVLLVLGLLSMGGMAYWRSAGQQRVTVAERDLLTQAQQALVGFAHANYRLPCPDIDRDGQEDCGLLAAPNHIGGFPWRTLQLPDAAAAQLKYGVYRAAQASGWDDLDLAVARDRMRPLIIVGSPLVVAESLLDNTNLPDLCFALSMATDTQVVPNPAALAVKDRVTAARGPMAFVLAAPGLLDADGDGDRFDGANHRASNAAPTFEAANQGRSDAYDDRVLVMGFDTLFAQLNCGQALSAIHHSHFNTAMSSAFMKQALIDYKYQLQVQAVLAGAGVASATAGVSMGVAGVANAAAALANATAFTVISYGTAAGLLVAATAAVVVNTAAALASVAPLAISIAVTVEAADRVNDATAMVSSSAALAASVKLNAKNADALGF